MRGALFAGVLMEPEIAQIIIYGGVGFLCFLVLGILFGWFD